VVGVEGDEVFGPQDIGAFHVVITSCDGGREAGRAGEAYLTERYQTNERDAAGIADF
jgi:hypothetical protein